MRRRLVDLVLAVILAGGLFFGSSTPRSAETAIPTAPIPSMGAGSTTASGNPSPQPEAPSASTPRPVLTPAPTPALGRAAHGRASWYGTGGPGLYAALPGYPDSPHLVVVCAFHPTRCVTLRVVTSCGCAGPPRKVIDLSIAAFSDPKNGLGVPLWRGVVFVTVQEVL